MRDGAVGTVVERVGVRHRFGVKTLLRIRLDDEALRAAAGGEQTGELSWFVSHFRVQGWRVQL